MDTLTQGLLGATEADRQTALRAATEAFQRSLALAETLGAAARRRGRLAIMKVELLATGAASALEEACLEEWRTGHLSPGSLAHGALAGALAKLGPPRAEDEQLAREARAAAIEEGR